MTAPGAKPSDDTPLDASGLVIGVVAARWNPDIVERLQRGAVAAVSDCGATAVAASAPGAFELPYAAQVLAQSGQVDAVVVVGAVIRGETTHYELVSEGCASGVMSVQLATRIPIGFGVATVENHEQAVERSSDQHNVGRDAALAAIEMALLSRDEVATTRSEQVTDDDE
ncbi:6,7-dimethyl-8-ribityllumazine synthase [bacterium]|nr:6,7-dimethyl-8-ribityllumazine synthase [bacterium]